MVNGVPLEYTRPSCAHRRVRRPRASPTTTLSARPTPSTSTSAAEWGSEKPPMTAPAIA